MRPVNTVKLYKKILKFMFVLAFDVPITNVRPLSFFPTLSNPEKNYVWFSKKAVKTI